MERRDLRIPLLTRERIRINGSVFPTDEGLDLLYREASLLAFRYNSELRKSGAESGFVSPGKLHASAVLHLIYQIVLSARMDDGHGDFFTRRIATVASNDDLSKALDFYARTFPSPAMEEKPGAIRFPCPDSVRFPCPEAFRRASATSFRNAIRNSAPFWPSVTTSITVRGNCTILSETGIPRLTPGSSAGPTMPSGTTAVNGRSGVGRWTFRASTKTPPAVPAAVL